MVTVKVTARLGGTKSLGYNQASQFSYLYLHPASSLHIFLVRTAFSASQLSSLSSCSTLPFSPFLTLSFYLFLFRRIQPGLVYQSSVLQIPEVEDCLILSDTCSYLSLFGLLPAKFPHSSLPAFPLLYPMINILLHMLVLSTAPRVAKATKESTRGAIHVFLPKGWWVYSWLLVLDSDDCFRWCSCMVRTGEAALIQWKKKRQLKN